MTNRLNVASRHLTNNYIAPVPTQFWRCPRSMARANANYEQGDGERVFFCAFSVLGYTRALSEDCMAMTGGMMDAFDLRVATSQT